jgi:CheY-like chemotaxis protein
MLSTYTTPRPKIRPSPAGNRGKTPFTSVRRSIKGRILKWGRASVIDGIITDWKEAGKMKRILVIDYDPAIRLLYEEELLEEGYEVISSDGGNGVLQLIADQRPDLILLELKLGSRNGLDLLRDIREDSWTTPVILLTVYPAMKFGGEMSSVHAYVTKNSDLTGLKQQIERCLNTPDPPYKSVTITGKESRAAAVKPAVQLSLLFNE